jgi:potassium voltage-gated channel Shab-related subfamily B protein 1
MSQADANSTEGDTRDKPTTTGTGCYKNYDHNMFPKNKNQKNEDDETKKSVKINHSKNK